MSSIPPRSPRRRRNSRQAPSNDVSVTNRPAAFRAANPRVPRFRAAGWPTSGTFPRETSSMSTSRRSPSVPGSRPAAAGGDYCRNKEVRRDQIAVFVLKGRYGPSFAPPQCTASALQRRRLSGTLRRLDPAAFLRGLCRGVGQQRQLLPALELSSSRRAGHRPVDPAPGASTVADYLLRATRPITFPPPAQPSSWTCPVPDDIYARLGRTARRRGHHREAAAAATIAVIP